MTKCLSRKFRSPLLILLLFGLATCREPVQHSFVGAWQALPVELQGEAQGLPAHWAVEGDGGAVSTANALATQAGIDILKQGGNAIDALVAVQWVLAVVEPQSSGLGGGGFLLYYDNKTRRVYALDGREEAPAAIQESIFLDSYGKPLPFSERVKGARAVGIPGTVALLDYAFKRWASSKFAFAQTFEHAIHLARNGIRVPPRLAQAMEYNRERLIRQNGEVNPYLRSGKAYAIGEPLYQSDLARTLERLATKGATDFYTGAIAEDIQRTVAHARDFRSAMTLSDLEAYRAVERRVEERTIGGARVFSVSAPSSGKYTLEALTLFESGISEREKLVRSLKAQRKAFIGREKALEDPDFAVLKEKTIPRVTIPEAQNTTHVAIADSVGNIVSYTSSVEMSMGSALVVKGRGFLLNNQLTDFTPQPGRINSIEQGRKVRVTALNTEARETLGAKRPKSSMSPLIILKKNGSYAALGSPGGPTIVGTNALVASRILSGEELQDALNATRAVMLPHGQALVELPIKRNTLWVKYLRAAGIDLLLKHNIVSLGSIQAVEYDTQRRKFIAASDLRREGLGLVLEPQVE